MSKENQVQELISDNTNLVIDLWVGLNGGYITTDEYKEMIKLQNLDDGSQSDNEWANESI